MINNINQNELLKYLIESDIINLDDVQQDMEKKKKEEILSKHKYKIFQDKDGRWKTTLPDKSKKDGRKLIAKSTYDKLEKAILEYYLNEEDKNILPELHTLREIYPQWIAYKYEHTPSSSYIRRIENDWKKYYLNNEIIDVPIDDLTYIKLDMWAHKIINSMSLTKKQYYNMSIILRQCLEYCVNLNYIQSNPFSRVKTESKMFTKKQKPKDSTQIFLEHEEEILCKYLLNEFEDDDTKLIALSIVLNFQLGLRIGELVSLKWTDINGNYIHVQRMEVATYQLNDIGQTVGKGINVVEHTKSFAGDREIYLNSEAQKVLKLIKKASMKHSMYCEDYIFVNKKCKRVTISALEKYLYRRCNKINIDRKSSHKIRKTYISSLFDMGLNINKIREIAGHEDERTSLYNYCFNRKTDKSTEQVLESNALKIIS